MSVRNAHTHTHMASIFTYIQSTKFHCATLSASFLLRTASPFLLIFTLNVTDNNKVALTMLNCSTRMVCVLAVSRHTHTHERMRPSVSRASDRVT